MKRRRLAAALVAVSTVITMACVWRLIVGRQSGHRDPDVLLLGQRGRPWPRSSRSSRQQNPGIKVEFSSAPPVAEYISTLQARILSGTAADVFAIAAENKTNLIDNGAVVDLTDEPFMANLTQFNKDTYGKDGRSYGASISSWGGGIIYNKKLLAKAGVKEFPKSWDEFLALSSKLKDQGVKYPFLESVQAMPIVVAAFVGAENAASGGTLDNQIFDGSSSFAATWTRAVDRVERALHQGSGTQGCCRSDRRSGARRVHRRTGRDDPGRAVGGARRSGRGTRTSTSRWRRCPA